MASITVAAAVVTPRLSHEGTTNVVVRTGGGEQGSIGSNTYMLAKIPNLVTVIDGYIRHQYTSGSAPVVVNVGGTNVASFTIGATNTLTRFHIPNLPLRISVSDDQNQFVWCSAVVTSGGTITAVWSLDLAISYAKFGAGESS